MNNVENENSSMVVAGAQALRINVTYGGQNGDLPQGVPTDASVEEIRRLVTEAVRAGGVPNIAADPAADFADFVVDRFPPTADRPHPLAQVRPKTPFGR